MYDVIIDHFMQSYFYGKLLRGIWVNRNRISYYLLFIMMR